MAVGILPGGRLANWVPFQHVVRLLVERTAQKVPTQTTRRSPSFATAVSFEKLVANQGADQAGAQRREGFTAEYVRVWADPSVRPGDTRGEQQGG